MESRSYYRAILKRIWLIVLCCLIGGGLAAYFGTKQVPIYSTSATLFLNPAVPSTLLPYYQSSGQVGNLASTYSLLMQTRAFSKMVADAVGPETSVGEVQGAVRGDAVGTTQFFRVTATASSPQTAQNLANTAAQVFVQENEARQRAAIQQQQQAATPEPGENRSSPQERQQLMQRMLDEQLKNDQTQITALQTRIAELQAQPITDTVNREIALLRQQLIDTQSASLRALTALMEAEARMSNTNTAPIDTAVIVDQAPLPIQPINSNATRNVLYALVLSLFAGIAGAFVLEYLDYTFRTSGELERGYGTAPLGIIPRSGKQAPVILANLNGNSPSSLPSFYESFQSLATNVQFASLDKPIRSLLVTSASPLEGKTFTAVNLAIAMARSGRSVILVDGDLRKPGLHTALELPNEFGLTSLILGNVPAEATPLQSTPLPGLKVLTSGSLPANPAEVLGSKKFAELINGLLSLADIVIFDSPPAIVSDAAILATKLDGVIQVVRAGSTRREVVLKERDNLLRFGARVLGPVLNMTREGNRQYAEYTLYGRQKKKTKGTPKKRKVDNEALAATSQK